ncbi:GNAT family N-acetyltransferase [Photobacterium angustum]|uniref:GNAT family N-acetyltransferase n=1 Tax=Photobacterium angustum TaxID=661 RepID=A0A2S7VXQ4_PHOAN|nr:GNAT family N-acetyltransferase [Photobacterium angustum]PQJ66876.1 GNAT family N-acetyltransferase [Photobacterium angustum]
MNFEILNDENALILETLISGVRKHNESTLGYEKKQSLSVIYRDEDNNLIGGITGFTIYKHFLINVLWVDEKERNKGIARKLMEHSEIEAKMRGCIAAQVDTLSIQAPNFYQKMGFEIKGKIPGFTESHDRYFLMKKY